MLMKHLAEQISRGMMEELQAIERKRDRSCWWRYLGPGLAAVDVLVAQEEPSSPQVFYLQVKVHTVGVFFCVWEVEVRRRRLNSTCGGLGWRGAGRRRFLWSLQTHRHTKQRFFVNGKRLFFLKTSPQTRGSHLLFHFKELHKIVREDALPSADLTHPPAGVGALLQTRTVKGFSLMNRWMGPRQTARRVAQRCWPWWWCWWFRPLWSSARLHFAPRMEKALCTAPVLTHKFKTIWPPHFFFQCCFICHGFSQPLLFQYLTAFACDSDKTRKCLKKWRIRPGSNWK